MTAHDELRARAEAATPGPWRHDGRGSVMALPHSRAQALRHLHTTAPTAQSAERKLRALRAALLARAPRYT